MSSASTTRTIKFVSKAGTYAAVIMCPDGDIYQEWEGSAQQVTAIYPNFAGTQPILYFVCTSSRVAEGVATPDAIDFYFNGTKITWNGDTSSGTFAGLFKKIAPSGGNLYYGIQIVQNIAAAAGYAPAVIKMVATISYGTQSDQIEASYTIPIQQATGSGIRVTIMSPDGKNFVISEKGGSCQLKAMAYLKGVELNPAQNSLSYEESSFRLQGSFLDHKLRIFLRYLHLIHIFHNMFLPSFHQIFFLHYMWHVVLGGLFFH